VGGVDAPKGYGMRSYVIAGLIGLALGLAAPVAAQVAQRLYGTTSAGVFVPVLVDSTGRLVVVQ